MGSSPVVVINQAMARQYFSDRDPVGMRIRIDSEQSPWSTIVGVAGDVHHLGLAREPEPEMYSPQAQNTWRVMTLVVRTAGDPAALAGAVREQVWAIDKEQPVSNLNSMSRILSESVAGRRFTLLLLNGFAAVALLLSAIGIYGVISYSVAQRTREIGIRFALGASRRHVLKLVVGQSLSLLFVGLSIGLIAAWYATGLMESLLFGTSATDTATIVLVSILLTIVGLFASYLPARRAVRLEPMVALRCE